MKRLQGKVVVITGGSSGMGFATAEQFVDEGAYVYITGRRQKQLDAAVAKIGKNIAAVQGDVSNQEDLDRLYTKIAEDKERIDVVFANAGIGNQMAARVIADRMSMLVDSASRTSSLLRYFSMQTSASGTTTYPFLRTTTAPT